MGRPKGSKNKKTKSKGLGDTVEKITKATGIKKLVGDCESCEKRKTILNKIFPYSQELSEERLKEWETFKNRENKNQVNPDEQKLIVTILRENLNMSVKPCVSCSGKQWLTWINKIDNFINK